MNIGIVGTNFVSDWMVDAIHQVKDTNAYAVYSRNLDTGNAFAKKHNIEIVYTDYDSFLNDENMDAVYIASPNFAHCEQAVKAMNAGKHVLCEKVIASNLNEFYKMKKAAEDNQVVLLEAVRQLFDPLQLKVIEQLKKIGKLRRACFDYCQYSSRYDRFKSGEILNAFNPKLSNAAVMDIGVYCIHSMVQIFGRPDEIKSYSIKLQNGMEGLGNVIMSYGDMLGEVVYSKIIDSVNPSVIQGEKGSILINDVSVPTDIKIIYRDGTTEHFEQTYDGTNMHYEVEEFVELIKNKQIDNPYLKYSEMTMEIIDEIRRQNNIVFPADSM